MEVILIIVAFFLFIWIVPLILRKPKPKYTKKEVDHAFLRLEAEVMASLNKVKSKEIDSEYILLTKKAYLKSTKWQSKRKQRLAVDHYSCAACSISGVPLDVHHLHYRSYQHEKMEDLASLCRSCHDLQHQTHGYDYNTDFILIYPSDKV